MTEFLIILWFIGLIGSYIWIYNIMGYMGLCSMFPEGKKWYHELSGLLSMIVFASYILVHPF